MNPKIIFALFITSAILFSCNSQTDGRLNTIDNTLTTLSIENRFSGNILIAEKGKIIYEKSFGYASDNKTLLSSNSIFNIASVSKTITAISIMILEERGLLSLDDNLMLYFPELPYRNITIKNLLTHSSGLMRIQSQPFRKEIEGKGFDNSQIIDLIQKINPELRFESGSDFYYANTNFIILGAIVKKVSKKSFDEFLNENIFQKAAMTQSFLKEKRIPKTLQNQLISYYRRPIWLSDKFQSIDTLQENISNKLTFSNVYGASSIYTTTRDLLKLHYALQGEKILKNVSLQKMYYPFKMKNNREYTINATSNYPAFSGLGWRVAKDSTKGKIVFHSGGLRGGRSFFIRNIDKNQCIIMLTNNEEMDRYNFTFPMRVLNNQEYLLDKISLARTFSSEYLNNGIKSALKKYHQFKNDEHYNEFVGFDFEEIGAELIEKKDTHAAIELYKLYTTEFSDEYSWSMQISKVAK